MASTLKNLSDFKHTTIPSGKAFKIALVISEWNHEITYALRDGALNLLLKHGVIKKNIQVVNVPGAFELTIGAQKMCKKKNIDAVIAIGCVIQGETKHFDFICNAVANGITNVSIKYDKPVIFGVLTTNNLQQAKDRAGGKHGDKGEEAAVTALKMLSI